MEFKYPYVSLDFEAPKSFSHFQKIVFEAYGADFLAEIRAAHFPIFKATLYKLSSTQKTISFYFNSAKQLQVENTEK